VDALQPNTLQAALCIEAAGR